VAAPLREMITKPARRPTRGGESGGTQQQKRGEWWYVCLWLVSHVAWIEPVPHALSLVLRVLCSMWHTYVLTPDRYPRPAGRPGPVRRQRRPRQPGRFLLRTREEARKSMFPQQGGLGGLHAECMLSVQLFVGLVGSPKYILVIFCTYVLDLNNFFLCFTCEHHYLSCAPCPLPMCTPSVAGPVRRAAERAYPGGHRPIAAPSGPAVPRPVCPCIFAYSSSCICRVEGENKGGS